MQAEMSVALPARMEHRNTIKSSFGIFRRVDWAQLCIIFVDLCSSPGSIAFLVLFICVFDCLFYPILFSFVNLLLSRPCAVCQYTTGHDNPRNPRKVVVIISMHEMSTPPHAPPCLGKTLNLGVHINVLVNSFHFASKHSPKKGL